MIKKNLYNLFSLAIIQGSNAVLPILIFPFILKTMGSDMYSDIVISEAIILIIFTIIVYSFDISGVGDTSHLTIEEDKEKLSYLFSKITIIRILILVFFFIFFLILSFFTDNLIVKLTLFWFLFPLSYVLQSSYLFQGLEKNYDAVCFILFSRLITVYVIYSYINENSDSYLVPLVIGISYFIGSISILLYILFKYKLSFVTISVDEIKATLKEGKEIFFGNTSVLLFRGSNIFILSLLNENTLLLSAYSLAEKYIKSTQALISPINQFFFPKITKSIKHKQTANIEVLLIILKTLRFQLFIILTIILSIFLYNDLLINLLLTESNSNYLENTLYYFLIMTPALIIGPINFMLGSVGLNNLNEKAYYSKSIIFTGLLGITVTFILCILFDTIGTSIGFVLSEFILLVFILNKYLRKRG